MILILGVRLTCKFVIPDIKRKKIIFLDFLKCWPSSHDFNKLVIKTEMHVNTYFEFFCRMKIQYDFFYF
jgi:hypothetical protein